jgi:putative endopeptidase
MGRASVDQVAAMRRGRPVVVGLVLAAALAGCRIPVVPPPPLMDRFAEREAEWKAPDAVTHHLNAAMQPSADPCTDFYQYACGGWPSGARSLLFGLMEAIILSRVELWTLLDEQLHAENAATAATPLDDFYASCADRKTIAARRNAPLQPLLQELDHVNGLDSLMAAVAFLHRRDIAALFSASVVPDPTDPKHYVLEVVQGGLELGEPQLYREETREGIERRRGLATGFAGVLQTIDRDNYPNEASSEFVQLETELARRFVPDERLYAEAPSTLTVEQLEALTGLPWHPYLHAIGLSDSVKVEVTPPAYFRDLGQLLAAHSFEILRLYLHVKAFDATASLLGHIGPITALWNSCVTSTEATLGNELWRRYAQRTGGDATRRDAEALSEAVRGAFEKRIAANAWLGPEQALLRDKVHTATAFVGFPAALGAPAAAPMSRDDFFGNVITLRQRWFDERILRVGQPVDAQRTFVLPLAPVPAYLPRFNQLIIPLGILRPPVFDARFPAAVNFGRLGTVVAHELAHAFSRVGRRFDAAGGRVDWNRDVQEQFAERTACLSRHYGRLEAAPAYYSQATASVQPALTVNSDLTLDENLSDVLGLRVAFEAYKSWAAEHAESDRPVGAVPADQAFFIAFAQNWCGEPDAATIRLLAEFDVHVPSRPRVNGAVSALPEFAEVFHCAAGSPLRPADTCQLL